MNQSVVKFWYILEQLTPFDFTRKLKDLKYCASISPKTEDRKLPWLNTNILREEFKLKKYDKNGNSIQYKYRIYLGIFNLSEVFKFVKSLPLSIAEYFSDLSSNEKNLSCFFSFEINENGFLIEESFSCSALPWALNQIKKTLTNSEELNLNGWTDEYNKYKENLEEIYFFTAKKLRESQQQITVKTLEILFNNFLEVECQWIPSLSNVFYYNIISIKKTSNEINTDNILNSFYLGQLENIIQAIKTNDISQPLEQYLSNKSERIFVEDRNFLQEILDPKFLQQGRWPSPPHYNLSLMQQCAVNLACNQLGENGGLFSVNGPPGTGKTTLLRELIAELIVKRAIEMTKYQNPMAAFQKINGFYKLAPSLTGFEIVVASSNNGAVENISIELPSIKNLAPQYQKQTSYFKKIAENVARSRFQKTNVDLNNDSYSSSYFSQKNDNSQQNQDNDKKVWGLIAAVLGNKKNCQLFYDSFWFGSISIRALLRQSYDSNIEDWYNIKKEFEQKRLRVAELIEEREIFASAQKQEIILNRQLLTERNHLNEHESNLKQSVEIDTKLGKQVQNLREYLKQQQDKIDKINSKKPSFFCRFFVPFSQKKYKQKLLAATSYFKELQTNLNNIEIRVEENRSKYSKTKQKYETFLNSIQEIEEQIKDNNNILTKGKKQLGEAFADIKWWNQTHENFQLSAPWIDIELNEARTELFLSALKVHELFICNSPRPFLRNIGTWVDMTRGLKPNLTPHQIKHIWQTFFLIVPVVSTTFASFGRLFNRLPTSSIGWLLIDEAGQCSPAAALNSLQNSQRALVLGDPLQIPPVFTVDPTWVEGIRQYFKIDEHWSPTSASVQSLSDRVNPYGTFIETNTNIDPLWIGCPLWVHRRCIEPMFSLSNAIAYDGKMVMATKQNSDLNFPLGISTWINIKGTCSSRHWVQAQGRKVIELLQVLVTSSKSLPNLYIISPFRNVSIEMSELLSQTKDEWAIGITNVDSWIKRSVGTVHTFQGKEADMVILLLGADSNSFGAAEWASSTPNILNVAATRAKYRLYIIGDRNLWGTLRFFDKAHQLLSELCSQTQPLDF
ncbi:MAG: AAA domain-containing protein [Prochloraceae cyanobacterium]